MMSSTSLFQTYNVSTSNFGFVTNNQLIKERQTNLGEDGLKHNESQQVVREVRQLESKSQDSLQGIYDDNFVDTYIH